MFDLTLPDHVTLIAVSKNQSYVKIQAALDAGLRQFGENRVQEAQRHWQDKKSHYTDLVLHLIGPLQSNKTADVVALFDCIHSVDRPKIAKILAHEMHTQNRHLPCFVQINIGNESQKSGIAPAETKAFIAQCRELGLNIVGLMAIPPVDHDAKPYFQQMQQLARDNNLTQLSMGMSDDYEQAIAYGATHVRIGSRLFGARDI